MIVALAITGCATGVHTEDGAPFELSGKSVLFVGLGDDLAGTGALVVTDDPVTCDELPPRAQDLFQDRVAAGGQGLILEVTYTLAAAPEDDPWIGRYTPNVVDRVLDPSGWNGSALLELDPSGAFVEVRDFGEKAKVEFDTAWWFGKVKAEVCELSTEVDCSPNNVSEFIDAIQEKACAEWVGCSDDPCPPLQVNDLGCLAYDSSLAEECLCDAWVCHDESAGFEYIEIPAACNRVCATAL